MSNYDLNDLPEDVLKEHLQLTERLKEIERVDSCHNNFLEFDLGGINKTTPIGIRKFKESLNGISRDNSGEYFCIAIF